MQHQFEYDSQIYRVDDAHVVLEVLRKHFQFTSVLDVGCGIGSWLRVLEDDFGVKDYLGVDASSFDSSIFHIEESQYLQRDLQQLFHIDRRFDLVMCLEVAEHLSEKAADTIVNTLVAHSDVVLFSAAIPGQGGQMHINEQWQSWWQHRFKTAGYLALDLIRPLIWQNSNVWPWYKQNILLYVKDTHPLTKHYKVDKQLDLVHPEIYVSKLKLIQELEKLKEKTILKPSLPVALKMLLKSILITPFRK